MNTNYTDFSYNTDFTPQFNIFNTNTTRFVGIGTSNPTSNLEVIGNCYVSQNLNLYGNLNIYSQLSTDKLRVLQTNKHGNVVFSELKSSNEDDYGIFWSLVNNDTELKFTLQDNTNNTRLLYKTHQINITSLTQSITVYSKETITLRYIYINDPSTVQPNTYIKLDSTYQSSLQQQSNPNYFKLVNYFVLPKETINNIYIYNLNNSTIQLFGIYNYYAQGLWNNSSDIIYTTNNIGVFTDNPTDALHINGNATFDNLTILENINSTNALITNNINIQDKFYTYNINTDNLLINTNNKPINVDSTDNYGLLNIGQHFKVKHNGQVNTKNIHFHNNLNLTSKYSDYLSLTNKSSIQINKTYTGFMIDNKYILNTNINYTDINTTVGIKTTNNSHSLSINGDVKIVGNITIDKLYTTTSHLDTEISTNDLNAISVSNNFNVQDNITTTTINTSIIAKDFISIPTTEPSNINSLYYNNEEFYFKDSQGSYRLITDNSINSNVYKQLTNNKLIAKSVTNTDLFDSDKIIVNKLDINKKLNISNAVEILYNLNTLHDNIYTTSTFELSTSHFNENDIYKLSLNVSANGLGYYKITKMSSTSTNLDFFKIKNNRLTTLSGQTLSFLLYNVSQDTNNADIFYCDGKLDEQKINFLPKSRFDLYY